MKENNLIDSLAVLRNKEKEIEIVLENTKSEIVNKIRSTPIPGVRKMSNIVSIVSLSNLSEGRLGAELYSVDSQANTIETALKSCEKSSSLIKKIQDMITDKFVKIGCNKHFLNETTISILKEFLGGQDGETIL